MAKEVEAVEEVERDFSQDDAAGEMDFAEENFDSETFLFAGGPTHDTVEGWKSLYQDQVFLSDFDGDVFIWRPILRNEYKRVVRNQQADSFYKEEKVCETCVLFPEGYGTMKMTRDKAGIPTMLFDMIMEKSGFSSRVEAMRL